MSPRCVFSDKNYVPLYNGNFYFFGKLRGIVGGVNFAIHQKIAPKVLF